MIEKTLPNTVQRVQEPDCPEPARDFVQLRSLKRQLMEELHLSWQKGNPVEPEALLGRWPGDAETDPDVASLLFQDYCQRQQSGDQISPEEYQSHFRSHRGPLAGLWDRQAFFRSIGGDSVGSSLVLSLPEVGDDILGFRLRRELGRGSFARVFCARQAALADRPVVVKVSAIDGNEPQTLAQLQHTNIVPIYSVHDDAAAGLRVVCMPYFGGAALSRILNEVWSHSDAPRHGSELIRALARCDTKAAGPDGTLLESSNPVGCPGKTRADGTPVAILSSLDYVQASAWIVARLAEALQHAHERGVLHRDIKPSNVLLSADAQPMLLDFNLAQSSKDSNAKLMATLGGTVAYMAPEHLRALAGRDPSLAGCVDQRADVYALGMVLYEMLTGSRPFDQSGSYSPMPGLIEAMAAERARHTPSLRAQSPNMPWTLESILRKCLAPDPSDRYRSAADFADDLKRFLEDRPLAHAPELSWAERIGKFIRRHPRLATAASVSAAASVVLGVGAAAWYETAKRLDIAQAAEAREVARRFDSGADEARCLVNTGSDFGDHVREGMRKCQDTLALFGVLERDDWQQQPFWQKLDAERQRVTAEEARELLMLLARARVYLSSGPRLRDASQEAAGIIAELCGPQQCSSLAYHGARYCKCQADSGLATAARQAACRNALALLDRAEHISNLNSSRALCLDRAWYLEGLGDDRAASAARNLAKSASQSDAGDCYLAAQSHFQELNYHAAAVELRHALALNPRHFWCHLMLGTCHFELQDPILAADEFRTCMTLWPESAQSYFHHALALQQLNKHREALEDYSEALRYDPDFKEAYYNRGLVHLNLNKPLVALADFDAAIAKGQDGIAVHGGRGLALEALARHTEADAAFARAWQCGDSSIPAKSIPMKLAYGFAIGQRLPEQAMAAFMTVLDRDPRNARALYGNAMLLARPKRDSEAALASLTLALEANPGLIEARCARANILAYRGEWERAREEADRCVKDQPSGLVLYGAACVYALCAQKCPEQWAPILETRAIELLREAVSHGYGSNLLAHDQDLAGIRHHPKFDVLWQRVSRTRVDR
jgi:serine/threonine protein kinase/Tfp pilus assembly protein PilF